MKKYMVSIMVFFMFGLILMACSEDNNIDNNASTGENSPQTNNQTNKQNRDDSTNENNNSGDNHLDNDNAENIKEVDDSADGNWGEDALGLGIGDTGILHNNFSKTEITLDSVEKIDDEDDETYYGHYTVLNMTVKNIGDESVPYEDIFEASELAAEDLDVGGEVWEIFDGVSGDWPDEIDVGEEASGRLVYDVEDAEEYEMQINFGLSSVSNNLSYEFNDDEIKNK